MLQSAPLFHEDENLNPYSHDSVAKFTEEEEKEEEEKEEDLKLDLRDKAEIKR
jgi:hypothetical protein